MASDQNLPNEDLTAAVERAKGDTEFMERLAQHVDRDRGILQWLADADHRERVGEAAERVLTAHDAALRRLRDS